MMNKILVYGISLILLSNSLLAQNLTMPISRPAFIMHSNNPSEMIETDANKVFQQLDRATRYAKPLHVDTGIIAFKDFRAKKVPAIFWALGAAGGYYLGNQLLYGDLMNVSYEGLAIYTISGFLVGAAVNAIKKGRQYNRLPKERQEFE